MTALRNIAQAERDREAYKQRGPVFTPTEKGPNDRVISTVTHRLCAAEELQREAEVVNRDWRFPLLLAGAALLVAATAIGMGALLDFVTTDLVEMTR